MTILAWILFGGIAGSLANMLDPAKSSGGLLGSIVLGIVGAVVGGFLASTFLGLAVTGFNLQSFIIAVLGSLLLLFLQRAFFRRV